jgi:hypothetical protein
VTAVARLKTYPADDATGTPERWVAHWAHPLEFELVSRGAPPPPAKFPALFFQVGVRCDRPVVKEHPPETWLL